MLGAGMAPGAYLAGSMGVLLLVATIAWGAWWLRAALLPEWSGAPARLAEAVLALTVPIGIAQLLGSFGAFSRGPMLLGCLGAGLAMIVLGRRRAARHVVPKRLVEVRASRPEEVVVAVAATAVVVAQWAMHVAFTLDRGMTHGDTLWYHAPFAARFLQTRHLTELSDTGLSDLASPLHQYLPLNGSLVHAIAMLPFGNDVLSPLVNLGFFALAVLAGWCVGRRRGVAALCVLGTVVLIGLPTLTGTQPGQASNDVVTSALFFAGFALLFEGELAPVPTALAAVAAGLALGTKLTVLVPVAVLTVGVVLLALRAHRRATAVAWTVALIASGGYWLVRNWIVAGNPVPWSEISIGPFTLDRAIESRPALVGILDHWEVWDRFIVPGFRDALGPAWFVILGLVVIGAAFGILRGRQPIERLAGITVLVGILALPFIPFSADFGGGIFVFIVRYLTPEFLLGLALLVLAFDDARVVWRRGLLTALAACVVLDVTSRYIEGAPLWPPGTRWVGVLTAAGVLVTAVLLAMPRARWRQPSLTVTGAALAAVCLTGGWFVQRHYLGNRYVDAGLPLDRVNAMFRDVEDARVAVAGTEHYYPLFGLDLSNDVSKVTGPARGSEQERCRSWRTSLSGFDYIVLARELVSNTDVPAETWVARDQAAHAVLRDGDATVYRIDGSLDPDRCDG